MTKAYSSSEPTSYYRRDFGTQIASKLSKDLLKKIKVLFDRVVVRLDTPEEKTKGGIFIPEKYQSRVTQGTVIRTGNGLEHDTRKKRPMEVKPGDRVLISKYDGMDIVLDGIRYTTINQRDILGIIT